MDILQSIRTAKKWIIIILFFPGEPTKARAGRLLGNTHLIGWHLR